MNQVKEALKKNTMVIALIIVAIFFTFKMINMLR